MEFERDWLNVEKKTEIERQTNQEGSDGALLTWQALQNNGRHAALFNGNVGLQKKKYKDNATNHGFCETKLNCNLLQQIL